MLIYHITAFFIGFVLDLIFGDPHNMPHPVKLIGRIISFFEKILYRGKNLVIKGRILLILVIATTAATVFAILVFSYALNPFVGVITESILTYYALSIKSLKDESMNVYKCVKAGNIEDARHAVSIIVGRDTSVLDEEGIIKAAVETVAENTSDGCIAPMIYLAVGGPVLGYIYKAVNTMDSMIGYKNDRYIDFGRAAAKFDDILNFIPSRISAVIMIIAAFISGKEFDGQNAVKIFARDRNKHESPNSAQTESVAAGALNIKLCGDAVYFGKIVHKPFIGDGNRNVEAEDIKRVNRLMYVSSILCEAICIVVMLAICFLLHKH